LSLYSSDIIGVATGIEVDACTTEVTDNSIISTDNTTNVPHPIHGTQLLFPPKIQEKINQELEPGEQVIFTKVLVPRVDCSSVTCFTLFFGAPCIVYSLILFIMTFDVTDNSLWMIIRWFCYNSFLPMFIIGPTCMLFYSAFFRRTFYFITDQRIITIRVKTIRSIDAKDFTDIIVNFKRIVYFQDWLTDPRGNVQVDQLWLPLDQDKTEIVAMLNTLKERESSINSTLEIPQPHPSMNAINMCPIVPPHIVEIINNELQGEEQVMQTVMPKTRYLSISYLLNLFGNRTVLSISNSSCRLDTFHLFFDSSDLRASCDLVNCTSF